LIGKRVISTRVEHEDAQILCLLQIGEYLVRSSQPPEVRLVVERGINRR
jgi:hypothetical protein